MTKSPRAVCNSVKRLLNLGYENRDRLLEYEVFFLEMIQCMCLPVCLFITRNMTQAHFFLCNMLSVACGLNTYVMVKYTLKLLL